jgi:hypothetical protein
MSEITVQGEDEAIIASVAIQEAILHDSSPEVVALATYIGTIAQSLQTKIPDPEIVIASEHASSFRDALVLEEISARFTSLAAHTKNQGAKDWSHAYLELLTKSNNAVFNIHPR